LCEANLFLEHVSKGIYFEQLLRWFALFPRKNFFIRSLEEYCSGGQKVFAELVEFIGARVADMGMDVAELKDLLQRRYNATHPPPPAASNALQKALNDFYRPYNEKLFALLGRRLW